MDWHSAFITQARSDYEVLTILLDLGDRVPLCQKLHYLQMTTEKLAKGFLTAPGEPPPPRAHDAFVRFVRHARALPNVRRACDFQDARQFAQFLNGILPIAQAIEDLSPEGDDHPNPEYPWEAGGAIFTPVEHDFPALTFRNNPPMNKLLMFVERCFSLV